MLLVSYIDQYFNTSITVLKNQVTDCTVQSAEYWCFYGTCIQVVTSLHCVPIMNSLPIPQFFSHPNIEKKIVDAVKCLSLDIQLATSKHVCFL